MMCSTGVSDPLCFSAPQPRSASAFAAAASRQLPCILLTSPSFRSCAAVSCSASDASFRNRRSFVVVSAANGSALMANSTPSKDGVHTVSDCMTKKDDLLVVKPSTTVEEALEIIVENRISGLPVVDDDWKLVGVVSDYDLLALDSVSGSGKTDGSIFPEADSNWKVFNELQRLLTKTNGTLISDVMTLSPLCVRENTNVEDSARLLLETRYRRLPVVDSEGKLVGIITRGDVIRAALQLKQANTNNPQ
ncbi:hypothetical protein V2J09_021864 [Rumex salicifolius]